MEKEKKKKKGHMVDGWLLTNRKHVGKTMNVSVLKAALKDGRMEKREMLIVKWQNRRGGVKRQNAADGTGAMRKSED